jgi:hypothetical protein
VNSANFALTEFSAVARRASGTLPRRPAAVRSDDITDQLERRWVRWHDAGWGYPHLKLSR